ncbi:RnfABCDGE type electron transport complex subunit D [Pseudomonas mangiferae]|nr:RnfABCDGE type electron transport complex subunit D [Pseudomonas mangiferae]
MTTAPTDPLGLDPRPAMSAVLLACLPGLLVLLAMQGLGVALQLGLCVATHLFCEAAVRRLAGQPRCPAERALLGWPPLAEGSGLVSALLLAVALPAQGPWWLAVSASAMASLGGKALFGGFGRNPLNPAMLGYAFVLASFPAAMNQWPAPAAAHDAWPAVQRVLGLAPDIDGWSQATVLDRVRHNDRLTLDELFAGDPAFGHVAGRLGEAVNLAFLLGGLYLLWRRVIPWQTPAALLGSLFLASLLGWNGAGSDSHGSPLFHLFAGATMLGAFFIVTEPVSGPRSVRARWLFGAGVGLLTYLIRVAGHHPDGLAFAVLLMNLALPGLERLASRGAPADA